MVCENCKVGGKITGGDKEKIRDRWPFAEPWHEACTNPATCTCQHKEDAQYVEREPDCGV